MDTTSLISQLKEEFSDRAKCPESLFLLNPHDAIDFIQRGRSLKLTLAGVEGFTITEQGAYQPHQEFSNDIMDSNSSQEDFVDSTTNLILANPEKEIWYQIVFVKE